MNTPMIQPNGVTLMVTDSQTTTITPPIQALDCATHKPVMHSHSMQRNGQILTEMGLVTIQQETILTHSRTIRPNGQMLITMAWVTIQTEQTLTQRQAIPTMMVSQIILTHSPVNQHNGLIQMETVTVIIGVQQHGLLFETVICQVCSSKMLSWSITSLSLLRQLTIQISMDSQMNGVLKIPVQIELA